MPPPGTGILLIAGAAWPETAEQAAVKTAPSADAARARSQVERRGKNFEIDAG